MIVLDLDNVLAGFNRAAFIAHGQPFNEPEERNFWHGWGMDDAKFWDRIHRHEADFYGRMVQPLPHAKKVLEMVQNADDFVIASAIGGPQPGAAWCAYGKFVFMHRHFPEVPANKIKVDSQKHLLAGPDRLLIDDDPENCDRFIQHGGQAFMFPTAQNTKKYPPMPYPWGDLGTVLDQWRARNGAPTALVTTGSNPFS